MDSKYSIFAKNKSALSESSSQNLKRKFTYCSSNSAPSQSKKPNLQNGTKLSNFISKPNFTQNGTTVVANKNISNNIQIQRQRLPVFAVREQ